MKIMLSEALKRATPGPWTPIHGKGTCFHEGNEDSVQKFAKHGGEDVSETIAEFWPTTPKATAKFDAILTAHCVNNLPRLLAAIKAERAAFSKTRFEVHAVPEGSTDEWLAARKETNAAVKMAEEVEA